MDLHLKAELSSPILPALGQPQPNWGHEIPDMSFPTWETPTYAAIPDINWDQAA